MSGHSRDAWIGGYRFDCALLSITPRFAVSYKASACAPMSWGWSLRVDPEGKDWVVTRRKLVMPVVGHDGWQLPQWQGSTIDYTR